MSATTALGHSSNETKSSLDTSDNNIRVIDSEIGKMLENNGLFPLTNAPAELVPDLNNKIEDITKKVDSNNNVLFEMPSPGSKKDENDDDNLNQGSAKTPPSSLSPATNKNSGSVQLKNDEEEDLDLENLFSPMQGATDLKNTSETDSALKAKQNVDLTSPSSQSGTNPETRIVSGTDPVPTSTPANPPSITPGGPTTQATPRPPVSTEDCSRWEIASYVALVAGLVILAIGALCYVNILPAAWLGLIGSSVAMGAGGLFFVLGVAYLFCSSREKS